VSIVGRKGKLSLKIAEFLKAYDIDIESLVYARIIFWPTLLDGKEPDLLILLGTASESLTVALLVEAKLYSQQHEITSEETIRSQLGHYAILHLLGSYHSPNINTDLPLARPILYITQANTIPKNELKRARAEVSESNSEFKKSDVGIFWCSWKMAGAEAKKGWHANRNDILANPWLRLLLDLYHDLEYFDQMPREPFQGCPDSQRLHLFAHYRSRHGIPPFSWWVPSDPYQKRAIGIPSLANNIPLTPLVRRDIGIPSFSKKELPIHNLYKNRSSK